MTFFGKKYFELWLQFYQKCFLSYSAASHDLNQLWPVLPMCISRTNFQWVVSWTFCCILFNIFYHRELNYIHDNVIKWKRFLRYWPFMRGVHRSTVISPQKASDAELWCFLSSVPEYKRLSKQSWGWWVETPSRSLWHHCSVIMLPEVVILSGFTSILSVTILLWLGSWILLGSLHKCKHWLFTCT